MPLRTDACLDQTWGFNYLFVSRGEILDYFLFFLLSFCSPERKREAGGIESGCYYLIKT